MSTKSKQAANSLDVKRRTAGYSKPGLDPRGRRRERVVRRRGCQHDQVDILIPAARRLQRSPSRVQREIGCVLTLGSNSALADARPLADPCIRRVERFRELLVCDNSFREVCPASNNDGTTHIRRPPSCDRAP